ncbi:MAG: hypothetical protein K8R36_06950 [Planctomycetales bacterium]|nr:hypothetical protein [Planctomycetales bacterium]
MKFPIVVTAAFLLSAFSLAIAEAQTPTVVDAVASVQGGARVHAFSTWSDQTDQLVVNAWLDSTGAAHGRILWDSWLYFHEFAGSDYHGPLEIRRDIEVTYYKDLSNEENQVAYLEGIDLNVDPSEPEYLRRVWIAIVSQRTDTGDQFEQIYGGHGTPMGWYEFYGQIYRNTPIASGHFQFK